MPQQMEIQPDTAAQLRALAALRQVSVDTLLRQLLPPSSTTKTPVVRWRLKDSMELLDEDLAQGSHHIARLRVFAENRNTT